MDTGPSFSMTMDERDILAQRRAVSGFERYVTLTLKSTRPRLCSP